MPTKLGGDMNYVARTMEGHKRRGNFSVPSSEKRDDNDQHIFAAIRCEITRQEQNRSVADGNKQS
jgi:hypothetical protein